MQAQVHQRVLRAFVRHALLDRRDGDEIGGWAHGGGFSLDATVRIAGADLAGRERLLRYCARPPFASSICTSPRSVGDAAGAQL